MYFFLCGISGYGQTSLFRVSRLNRFITLLSMKTPSYCDKYAGQVPISQPNSNHNAVEKYIENNIGQVRRSVGVCSR